MLTLKSPVKNINAFEIYVKTCFLFYPRFRITLFSFACVCFSYIYFNFEIKKFVFFFNFKN
jgi:hypothetical protein